MLSQPFSLKLSLSCKWPPRHQFQTNFQTSAFTWLSRIWCNWWPYFFSLKSSLFVHSICNFLESFFSIKSLTIGVSWDSVLPVILSAFYRNQIFSPNFPSNFSSWPDLTTYYSFLIHPPLNWPLLYLLFFKWHHQKLSWSHNKSTDILLYSNHKVTTVSYLTMFIATSMIF